MDVLENGKFLRLLDRSEWEVKRGDTVRSSNWQPFSTVIVVAARNSNNAVLIQGDEAVHAVRVTKLTADR